MGREIKRVALDFDWPLNKVWEGFLMPERFRETSCEDCGGMGWSDDAKHLQERWYGKVPFSPEETGSDPYTIATPEVRAFAERNIASAPYFYGTGGLAIQKEAQRLADLWNGMWMHHLSQEEVDILVAEGKLRDFTHTWTRETGWVAIEPTPVVTAEQVNRASLSSFGGSSGLYVLSKHILEAQGKSDTCSKCAGHGSFEAYPGQREEAEKWEMTEPPAGEGWQVWETVSEGSPISPVFADREGLIRWLMSPAYSWGVSQPLTREQAENFTGSGWAPTFIATAETGLVNGEQFIGKDAK